MASIKDSLEETIQDVNSILKFIIFTVPLYYTVVLPMRGELPFYYPLLYAFTAIFLFGFMLKCTYNVRKGEKRILPSFNIFDILFTGLKGFVALLPLAIIGGIIASALVTLISNYFDGTILKVFTVIIDAICASFAATGYLLYAKKFKIVDAYNVKYIVRYCADVMIAVFFMEIQLFLVNLVIVVPVTYFIWVFFGLPNPIALFFWCMIGVLNFAMSGHYLAQIDYEIIALNEEEIKDEELRFAKKK